MLDLSPVRRPTVLVRLITAQKIVLFQLARERFAYRFRVQQQAGRYVCASLVIASVVLIALSRMNDIDQKGDGHTINCGAPQVELSPAGEVPAKAPIELAAQRGANLQIAIARFPAAALDLR